MNDLKKMIMGALTGAYLGITSMAYAATPVKPTEPKLKEIKQYGAVHLDRSERAGLLQKLYNTPGVKNQKEFIAMSKHLTGSAKPAYKTLEEKFVNLVADDGKTDKGRAFVAYDTGKVGVKILRANKIPMFYQFKVSDSLVRESSGLAQKVENGYNAKLQTQYKTALEAYYKANQAPKVNVASPKFDVAAANTTGKRKIQKVSKKSKRHGKKKDGFLGITGSTLGDAGVVVVGGLAVKAIIDKLSNGGNDKGTTYVAPVNPNNGKPLPMTGIPGASAGNSKQSAWLQKFIK